uniref:Putative secreted protein n=1 Tax=Anopheles marajoara TaxID=58244 RepID=A0A2M4CGJ6_9DIPT
MRKAVKTLAGTFLQFPLWLLHRVSSYQRTRDWHGLRRGFGECFQKSDPFDTLKSCTVTDSPGRIGVA